ncbi:hypothetical protein NJC40_03905 [Pseudomonas sp. 21LCFQ02]|nr:hypothetical protein [Pseudomonas sp. 21LCFQ02]MCO8166922.1 hypothetical protein [Pseudomonas sp. 21LCFQ02]
MPADEDYKHEPEHDHLLDHEFATDSFEEEQEGDDEYDHDPFADEIEDDE